jgi:hypothetical protein
MLKDPVLTILGEKVFGQVKHFGVNCVFRAYLFPRCGLVGIMILASRLLSLDVCAHPPLATSLSIVIWQVFVCVAFSSLTTHT